MSPSRSDNNSVSLDYGNTPNLNQFLGDGNNVMVEDRVMRTESSLKPALKSLLPAFTEKAVRSSMKKTVNFAKVDPHHLMPDEVKTKLEFPKEDQIEEMKSVLESQQDTSKIDDEFRVIMDEPMDQNEVDAVSFRSVAPKSIDTKYERARQNCQQWVKKEYYLLPCYGTRKQQLDQLVIVKPAII